MHEPIPPGHGEQAPELAPARCPYDATILQSVHPASRRDGRLEGWCPGHGLVAAAYGGREAILERAGDEH